MITVADGTGLVGKTLTQALVGDGEQVRVLTRDPKAARAAFGYTGVEIVGVDFDDASTLRAGFTGSDTAFIELWDERARVEDLAHMRRQPRPRPPQVVMTHIGDGEGGASPIGASTCGHRDRGFLDV